MKRAPKNVINIQQTAQHQRELCWQLRSTPAVDLPDILRYDPQGRDLCNHAATCNECKSLVEPIVDQALSTLSAEHAEALELLEEKLVSATRVRLEERKKRESSALGRFFVGVATGLFVERSLNAFGDRFLHAALAAAATVTSLVVGLQTHVGIPGKDVALGAVHPSVGSSVAQMNLPTADPPNEIADANMSRLESVEKFHGEVHGDRFSNFKEFFVSDPRNNSAYLSAQASSAPDTNMVVGIFSFSAAVAEDPKDYSVYQLLLTSYSATFAEVGFPLKIGAGLADGASVSAPEPASAMLLILGFVWIHRRVRRH